MIKKSAVLYIRFSSDKKRNDSQVEAMKEYAKCNGFDIKNIYVDCIKKSAPTDQRLEFQRMMKDSALGLFEATIIYRLDQFSRDLYDFTKFKKELKQNGVQLISMMERLDGSPQSILLESLLESMAEIYKDLKRRRITQ